MAKAPSLWKARSKGTERTRKRSMAGRPWSPGHAQERFESPARRWTKWGRAGCGESRQSGSVGGMRRRTSWQRALSLPDWGAYTRHLDPEVHSPGKRNTQKIERKHLTLRTRIKRLVRKTISR
jgi:hypothetical protein